MLKKVFIEVFLERTLKALNGNVLNVIYELTQDGREQARIIYENADYDIVQISDMSNGEVAIELIKKVCEIK